MSTQKYRTEPESGYLRIIAVRDIPGADIRTGDRGGLIQSENNLDQDGDCWIGPNAQVIQNAHISGNAQIRDRAIISGTAEVTDEAVVGGFCIVTDHVFIVDSVILLGQLRVVGSVFLQGDNIHTGCRIISRSPLPS